ncbi:hypothetical protein [Thermus phage TSP4]|nr:hypothetical protein [Thermus phage TSP4]
MMSAQPSLTDSVGSMASDHTLKGIMAASSTMTKSRVAPRRLSGRSALLPRNSDTALTLAPGWCLGRS